MIPHMSECVNTKVSESAQPKYSDLCRDTLITIVISTNGYIPLRESRRRVPYLCEEFPVSH
jgi:hypothetical protein